jgi:hypothetical protein
MFKGVKEIFIVLDSYENSYLEEKLKSIYIEVTEIKNWFHLGRKFIQPQNLYELKEYTIASCYVPFLFWFQNPLYYTIQNKKYCDGFFGNFSNVNNDFIKINSYNYSTLIPLSEQKFLCDFQKGTLYDFQQKNTIMTFSIFCKIIFKFFLELSFYILFNFYKNLKIIFK